MFYYLVVIFMLGTQPMAVVSIPAGTLQQCEALKSTTSEQHYPKLDGVIATCSLEGLSNQHQGAPL